jgi:hypothetical protein
VVTYIDALPEPAATLTDPSELLPQYLDAYRTAVLRKLDGLSDAELRTSRLPSGWTPIELLNHLAYVERRWLQWGFEAQQVDAPRGDDGPDGRWHVADKMSADDVKAFFTAQCEKSRQIIAGAELGRVSRTGGRFKAGDDHPALIWILFHLLQEYARHLGHLDVARELADGVVGE